MRHSQIIVMLCLAIALPAWAAGDEGAVELTLFPVYKAQVQLADAGSGAGNSAAMAPDANERAFADYRPPRFSANKLHQYLGIGSLTLATLAIISPKDDDGGHTVFGAGAAALGAGAVVSGLIVHGDDVGFSQGMSDPDNLHALFATLGAAGYIAAASVGGEKDDDEDEEGDDGDDGGNYHAILGITGYASMLIGIRIAW